MQSPHIEAEFQLLPTSDGGRKSPIFSGYRGQFHLHGLDDVADVEWYFPATQPLMPGTSTSCRVWFVRPEAHLPGIQVGDDFEVREGSRIVGRGKITAILK